MTSHISFTANTAPLKAQFKHAHHTVSLIDKVPLPPALEILALTLGQEEYGIDVQKIRESRAYDAVTRVANTHYLIDGVVNLRGVIVPIIDMRIKFNLGTATYDSLTVVVILRFRGQMMGMVVDSVADVIALTARQGKPARQLGGDFLIVLAALDERMLILVDVDRLMSSSEPGLCGKLAA